MRKTITTFAILTCPLLALWAAPSRADTDSGRASADPWSGYWWQHKTGGLTGPLRQYDKLVGTQAAEWEGENHVGQNVPDWHGHCHAWAASSVSERQPTARRNLGSVRFTVGDQKGLLAACHSQDIANSYGDRFGDGQGSDDPADLAPDELWRLLQMYIKQKRIPIILDLEAGEQVWNYPVYQYKVEYQPAASGWSKGVLHLEAADNNVPPDYVGTQPAQYRYTFRFKMQDGAVLSGSGEWTGGSVEDHPDFAWYPYVAIAENPAIDVAEVAKVVGYAVGGSNSPPDQGSEEPPPDDEASPTDNPPANDDTENTPPPPVDTDSVVSPDGLLAAVLNKTSSFALDIFVDKGDGGRYAAGEPIRVSVRSAQPGYLYLFDIGPDGEVELVFPVAGQPNRIDGDVLYDLPGKNRVSKFTAQSAGQHDLKGIVTKQPVRITGFAGLPSSPQQRPSERPKQPSEKAKAAGDRQRAATAQLETAPPEKMTVYPACLRRLKGQLYGVFRKGQPAEESAPGPWGPFAQDMCSYFVLPKDSQDPS